VNSVESVLTKASGSGGGGGGGDAGEGVEDGGGRRLRGLKVARRGCQTSELFVGKSDTAEEPESEALPLKVNGCDWLETESGSLRNGEGRVRL